MDAKLQEQENKSLNYALASEKKVLPLYLRPHCHSCIKFKTTVGKKSCGYRNHQYWANWKKREKSCIGGAKWKQLIILKFLTNVVVSGTKSAFQAQEVVLNILIQSSILHLVTLHQVEKLQKRIEALENSGALFEDVFHALSEEVHRHTEQSEQVQFLDPCHSCCSKSNFPLHVLIHVSATALVLYLSSLSIIPKQVFWGYFSHMNFLFYCWAATHLVSSLCATSQACSALNEKLQESHHRYLQLEHYAEHLKEEVWVWILLPAHICYWAFFIYDESGMSLYIIPMLLLLPGFATTEIIYTTTGKTWVRRVPWELLLIWHCIAVKAFISLPKRTWSSKQAVIITLEVVMGVRLGPERTSRWMKSQEWNKRLQSKREHTKRQCLQHRRGFLPSFNS